MSIGSWTSRSNTNASGHVTSRYEHMVENVCTVAFCSFQVIMAITEANGEEGPRPVTTPWIYNWTVCSVLLSDSELPKVMVVGL